ncbi:MAG: PilZ domain-containing protein [Myxococcota bacterium]
MVDINDKRVAVREPVHFVAEIDVDGQRLGCGVSRNASGVGLLLLTHLELAPGTPLTLRLYVPGEEDPRLIRASVVRCEKIPAEEGLVWAFRAGVQLEDPPTDLQHIIENLSKHH